MVWCCSTSGPILMPPWYKDHCTDHFGHSPRMAFLWCKFIAKGCTQNTQRRRVVVALVGVISAYDSPSMGVVLHWSNCCCCCFLSNAPMLWEPKYWLFKTPALPPTRKVIDNTDMKQWYFFKCQSDPFLILCGLYTTLCHIVHTSCSRTTLPPFTTLPTGHVHHLYP